LFIIIISKIGGVFGGHKLLALCAGLIVADHGRIGAVFHG